MTESVNTVRLVALEIQLGLTTAFCFHGERGGVYRIWLSALHVALIWSV